jgi:hypothetical protein
MTSANARIDLHGYDSERAKSSILALIDSAQASGTLRVEIVHGRGKGVLAQVVRDVLRESPKVSDIGVMEQGAGMWARLRKISEMPPVARPQTNGVADAGPSRAQLARDLLKQSKRLDLPGS